MFTLGQTSTDNQGKPNQAASTDVATKRADTYGTKKEDMAGSIQQREKHGVSLRDKRK